MKNDTIETAIDLATREQWDAVDELLADKASVISLEGWAQEQGFASTDANVLDLACSVLERSNNLGQSARTKLEEVMHKTGDAFEFARFRAACALFAHDDRSTEVITHLMDSTASTDEEVRDIANQYLQKLDSAQLESYFEDIGYHVETGFDEPGFQYTPHFHERTVLVTLGGSLKLTTDSIGAKQLHTGDIVVVKEKENHSAVVGKEGWKWLAAFSKEDSKRYPGRH